MNQQEILKRISIINVKNKLGLEELFSKKDIIYVKCPFCYSKNGAMKLNITNNSYSYNYIKRNNVSYDILIYNENNTNGY